tara:strand:+ start:10342 stop:10497 length:156 start_codon:yes stop_codon:yes gene_type:complete
MGNLKTIVGQDISHVSPGLFPESFYDEDEDIELDYDDASLDGAEIDYTTQS